MFGKFGKKKEVVATKSDNELLIELMDQAIAGNFALLDLEQFQDKAVAKKYNEVLSTFIQLNNNFVMRLNDSMKLIGDSSCVKDMIEEVNSQTTAINNLQSSSQELGTSIQNIKHAVYTIQEKTHTVKEDADACVDAMNTSINIVDDSVEHVLQITQQVADFQAKAAKINEIIDMVKKIASKSNLLALNASIEAARAGEVGKGFAVVANQVKELSASSMKSAEDAMVYVDDLLTGINSLEDSVNRTVAQLTSGNESIHESLEKLQSMDGNMKLVSSEVDHIYGEIDTQSSLTTSFLDSIKTMASSYEDLSNGCVNTGAHMYKISRLIDNLRSDVARRRAILYPQDWIIVYEIDHLIFTWRIYNNLADFEKLKLEQVNNPTGCKFGKWVAAQTDPRITNSSAFKQAVKYHNEIHEHAVDSWNAKHNGDRAEAFRHFQLAYAAYPKFVSALKDIRRVIASTGDTRVSKIEAI
ncbi:MAG: CZB domain-containing protein [Lachnospiraceae bacterium]|nr:CZB domain-containing protein [Lachnospiraceae bacterium]MBQ8118263.1 CZB domain-containing protein [Lachnospiraceae bacterium]